MAIFSTQHESKRCRLVFRLVSGFVRRKAFRLQPGDPVMDTNAVGKTLS
jgi:hypothetical protein